MGASSFHVMGLVADNCQYRVTIRCPLSIYKVCFCGIAVCHEGFAQIQQCAGLIVAVGVGAVLEGCGHGGIAGIDLYGDHLSQLGSQQGIQGEGVEVTGGIIDGRFRKGDAHGISEEILVADLQRQIRHISGIACGIEDESQADLAVQIQRLACPGDGSAGEVIQHLVGVAEGDGFHIGEVGSMGSGHILICQGIATVALEELCLCAIAEKVCTEGLQTVGRRCLVQLRIGIVCHAVVIRGGVIDLSVLLAVEDGGNSVVHFHSGEAGEGEVVVISLIFGEELHSSCADVELSVVDLQSAFHIDRVHIKACKEGLGKGEVYGNITCQIQGVIQLQTGVFHRLFGFGFAADTATVCEAVGSFLGLSAISADTTVGLSINSDIGIAVPQSGEDGLRYKNCSADGAILPVRQTGIGAGGSATCADHGTVSLGGDHILRHKDLLTGGAFLTVGQAGFGTGGSMAAQAFGSMSHSGDHILGNKDQITDGAVTALCKTCGGTGGSETFIGNGAVTGNGDGFGLRTLTAGAGIGLHALGNTGGRSGNGTAVIAVGNDGGVVVLQDILATGAGMSGITLCGAGGLHGLVGEAVLRGNALFRAYIEVVHNDLGAGVTALNVPEAHTEGGDLGGGLELLRYGNGQDLIGAVGNGVIADHGIISTG